MKGLFIPDITAEMFRNASLESVEELMAEGRVYDIDYQEPCEDTISKKEVLEYIDKMPSKLTPDGRRMIRRRTLEKYISDMQLVTPQSKMGEWIFFKTAFDKYGCTVKCSSCHKRWKTYDEIRWKEENKFCPNCGERKGE